MWAAQYYHFPEPRRWLNSGGLGTMGFGLPAAIGAKVALPDQQVVCLAGDGSLIMVCQEFATAAAHDLADQGVPDEQRPLRHGPPVAGAVLGGALPVGRDGPEPRLGEAGRGLRLDRDPLRSTRTTSAGSMKTALETDGPVLLDVRVTQNENCYPMIPAGAAARDMVG